MLQTNGHHTTPQVQVLGSLGTNDKRLASPAQGSPWAVASEGHEAPYFLVSWGSLSRACYEAFRVDPQNAKVQLTLKHGLRGAASLKC